MTVKTSLKLCLVTLSEGYRIESLRGLLWGLERTQDMRISCGGEPGNFLFPFEL